MTNNIYRLRRPPTELEKRQIKKAEQKQKAKWFMYGFIFSSLVILSLAFLFQL